MMAAEGEIQFPEPIIQLLQSFLDGKEAARTATVCKSWHHAWLTRPNLDFNDTHFRGLGRVDDFSEHAQKTIERYEQSNLKIESFKLCMNIDRYGDLANKLSVKALGIGATCLCLRLYKRYWSNLFVLTNEVFGADNLVELSVRGCRINLDDGVVIKCPRLESLSLDDEVGIKFETFSKIISSCPSIEKLSLLSYIYWHHYDEFEVYGLEYDEVKERGRKAAAMAVGLVDNLIPRLRCLVLGYESFKTLCQGDLLSRFPFLKDFTLYLNRSSCSSIDTIPEEGIQISSCKLERINLVLVLEDCPSCAGGKRPRVNLDVPSVRKFTFEGAVIPHLSFMSTPPSREWESRLSIKCQQHGFSIFWFNELSELLTQLSRSKTHLSLHIGGNWTSFDYEVGDNTIQVLRKHDVESLTIDMTNVPSSSCCALFDGLFRLCRPKLITQYYEGDPDKRRYDHDYKNDSNMEKTNIDFLCRTLDRGIILKVSNPTQFMYGLNDLEEVNAQIFDVDDVPAEWRPIPIELLLDVDSPHKYVQAKQRIRLLLKWKPN